jgi:cytochrome P450
MNITPFDPRSAAIMDDPFPCYRDILHARGPVYSPSAEAWLFGDYENCSRILADGLTYSVARGVQLDDETEAPEDIPLLVLSDPPDHGRLRHFVAPSFRESTVKDFGTAFAENMAGALESVRGRDEVDVMAEIVMPWAIENSLELLEIPAQDREKWRDWMAAYLRRERGNIGFTTAGHVALEEAMAYVVLVHLTHLRSGGDSFLRRILRHEVDGSVMTDAEALGLLMTMVVVGAEDSARTFANVLHNLDQLSAAGRRPELDEAAMYNVIDETIRYSPSTHFVRRTTTREVVEGGVRIPAGEKVLVLFGAANRDPAVFSDPDVFDPERPNAQQAMGFSRGAHSCLGIHVARLQLREGLRVFLDNVATHDIRYDQGEWVHAMNISGYQTLPGALTWR